jgi:anti-sigma B factor antagonist
MEIIHRRLPRVDVLALTGRMQAPEAEEFKARIDQLFAEGHVRLILDLAGLEFMSSPGLRVLIDAQRRAQNSRAQGGGRGDIRLANASPNIRDILARTGFTSFFQVYDTLVDAVGSM